MRAIALALFALATGPGLAEEADFRAWHVSCDTELYCAATTASDDNALRIARHAQETYWEMALVAGGTLPDEWQDFVVSVDGDGETFGLRSEIGAYGAVSDFYLLGDKAQRILDLMMPGSGVTVSYTDVGGGARETVFPLSGLSAALLWIDERQGRVGSERVASAAPYGLTPAGQEQTETPNVPQAVLDRHAIDPDCEPFETLANGRDFTISNLDAEHTLYLIPCWSAAYNFGWKVYVESAGSIEPQYFADYSLYSGWTGTPTLVNVYYDPEFKELGSFYKARGPGDCGSSGTWKWTGYVFRMTEFRAKECDDGTVVDENAEIGDFPVIFTAPPLPQE